MKTQILLSTLILASTLIISKPSHADSFSKKHEAMNPASLILTDYNVSEEVLQIEEWMTDENVWSRSGNTMVFRNTIEEEELQIKEWMTSNIYFRVKTVNNEKIEETENILCIEDWMTDNNLWRF